MFAEFTLNDRGETIHIKTENVQAVYERKLPGGDSRTHIVMAGGEEVPVIEPANQVMMQLR